MSPTTTRTPPPRDGDSVDRRLARLLDTPRLARVVPHLAPETLHRLIRHRGLEACGELVASATPAQLTSLLDLDLWRQASPGRDDRFDADRFGEWLEVLVETGEVVAARTVAVLDTALVILGLSRYVRVFDPGTFEPTESSDDEARDRDELMNSETSADVPECEVGGYLVRARRPDAWDAIVTLLVTLEDEDASCFHALMQGCRRLSNSRPEVDGLDDLPPAPAQHAYDVAAERERRRSRDGYASPADARAFLQMARQRQPAPRPSMGSAGATSASTAPLPPLAGGNPIAAAYFRAIDGQAGTSPDGPFAGAHGSAPHEEAAGALADGAEGIRAPVEGIIDLLTEAGMMPDRPRALIGAADEELEGATFPILKRLMRSVLQRDERAYLARSRELAFLANTLLAGCSIQSRPFTPEEASQAAAGICNLGLECWPGATSPHVSPPRDAVAAIVSDTFLVDHDLVTAFEHGWAVVYQEVSLFVADQLISTLADIPCVDAETRNGLRALERTLRTQRAAGTPWLARDAADVLATLDTTAWISVVGLLDECPILPDALRAMLERRRTAVSATAFEFISTRAQIGDVRLFMRTLPGVWSS
jgi:hypothetical protein